MRSGVGLCVLGLLCLHSSAFGQVVKADAGVLIFCDDPTVEKAVSSAIHKFNERLHTGYMLALSQIVSARKSENGSDSLYSLEFSTRRSDCLAGSNKPWTDCEYLPFGRMEPLSCNATVHMTETETETKQVECLLDDFIVPEKAPCLGCPVKIDETSEDLKVPLFASISKYNLASDATHLFTLNEVGFATRQVVAGFRFKLRFDMMKTVCAKAEHKDLNELCVPDEEKMEFVNCNSTVDVAPWRFEQPEAHIECEKGALFKRSARRRPPGWSPLRNFLLKAPTTASPSTTSPPLPCPSKVSAKEESSEEDTTASKPVASPDTANENPFHCPSKSWKPFQPVNHALPTEATSLQPPVDGAFSDTDLLS
ncbi:kininogen-1 [Melanotaenia boesemani]|uniref:kininogen-1 n=1 Tax=Melanotaenia boesemani TaxID=1250792 RepID=UPI001C03EC21|nr:kininogen-1 [Melanotaenia boesemani]